MDRGSCRENATRQDSPLTVVKIGGSLLGSPDLEPWLSALAEWDRPVVVVPGGGPFAEAVRSAQAAIGFDDVAAHRMALLAMEQVAVLLASRSPRSALAASRAEIEEALRREEIPVWLPSAMVLAAPDVPASWDVTSDSLAAWLAGVLAAERLLLVKSREVAAPVTAQELTDAGIVDPFFPTFAARLAAMVHVAGPASLPGALDVLRAGGMPGITVTI